MNRTNLQFVSMNRTNLQFVSMNICNNCHSTNTGSPLNNGHLFGCWSQWNAGFSMNPANLGTYLLGTAADVQDARDRISSAGPWSSLTNRQKRLVLYLKLFRFLYGFGRSGVRIPLPRCLVARIRRMYPDAGANYDGDEESE